MHFNYGHAGSHVLDLAVSGVHCLNFFYFSVNRYDFVFLLTHKGLGWNTQIWPEKVPNIKAQKRNAFTLKTQNRCHKWLTNKDFEFFFIRILMNHFQSNCWNSFCAGTNIFFFLWERFPTWNTQQITSESMLWLGKWRVQDWKVGLQHSREKK